MSFEDEREYLAKTDYWMALSRLVASVIRRRAGLCMFTGVASSTRNTIAERNRAGLPMLSLRWTGASREPLWLAVGDHKVADSLQFTNLLVVDPWSVAAHGRVRVG